MTTQVMFRVDPAVKARAMRRAKRDGVPFASVLKMMTQAFADGEYSVKLVREERFNAKTAREIRAALRDIEKGKNLSPAFTKMDDAIRWLHKK